MARGDGIDRTNARNMRLTETKIGNTQQHNEREKDSYVNQDIVPERTPLNVHFKAPSAGYQEMFCIRVKHRLHKGQRAQSRERWRFAKQIQPDLDCGKKAAQWEGAVRQALPNGLGYFYRYTPVPAGFTT